MDENINNEHDLGYKHILAHKRNFIDFLKSFVKKDWVDLVKEENLVLIDKEFILQDFKEEEADLVYKVNINGNDVIFYVLLELQSKVDYSMPIRLMMYMSEIWRDELKNTQSKEKKRKDYKLPAIIPMVLYNGKNNWTAVKSFKEVLNGYELFEENIVDFKYLLFDINRMEKEELIEIANVVSTVFLLDQDVEREEIIDRLKTLGRVIRRNTTKEQEKSFKTWLINIFANRFEGKTKEELNRLLTTPKMEVEDMMSNLGRRLEEEIKVAKKQGIEEGIKEGMEKGMKKGVINTAKNLLMLGMDEELVKSATQLSQEQINEIKEQIEKEMN